MIVNQELLAINLHVHFIYSEGKSNEAGQGGLMYCRGPFLVWIGGSPGFPKAPSSGSQSGPGLQLPLQSGRSGPIANPDEEHSRKRNVRDGVRKDYFFGGGGGS
jgi:hypothetical protein